MPYAQSLLLDLDAPTGLEPLTGAGSPRRLALDDRSWIEVRRGWVSGSDALFDRLVHGPRWQAERRRMYDRVVDVPRLTAFLDAGTDWPDEALTGMRDALTGHYRLELPTGFATVGLCLYRDGRDSVAWHGDTIGAGAARDTVVAIVSLGAPRVLALRPRARGAGPAHRITLGPGDLLVMGGACQREWEHAVPKTARPVGPRISLQFREAGVR
jgi:alkylated DNA repair dioxygenase AlkB